LLSAGNASQVFPKFSKFSGDRLSISTRSLTSRADYKHNVVLIMIGEFEFLILSAAAHLGEDAYGAAMREVIETAAGRTCSLGALYTTLDRLEAKGLVETQMSAPTQERGGRAKRMVRVTGNGTLAAREFYESVVRISVGTAWGRAPRDAA
jgi:PadR family transcriptional regulator, regulatory protein PadR